MRDFYRILEKLNDQNVSYLFQSQRQPRGTKFYNLSYECPKGDTHLFHEHDLSVIEKALSIHWGHLLTGICPAPSKVEFMSPSSLPLPPGFPKP